MLFLPDGLRRIECTFRDYRGARNALLFRRKQGKSGYKVVNTVKDPNLTGEFIP